MNPFQTLSFRISHKLWIVSVLLFILSGCATRLPPVRDIDYPTHRPAVRADNLLASVTRSLRNRKLYYSARPGDFRDCSGIFHRVMARLHASCPDLERPGHRYRSTRHIARWYAGRGDLVLVNSPLAFEKFIKPGTIMFFGKEGRRYRYMTLKKAFKEISHIGIVVSIKRNIWGRIETYGMFHGRSMGKPAATTFYHTRVPTRRTYTPYGNGNQQWIACAPVCPAGACGCTLIAENQWTNSLEDPL